TKACDDNDGIACGALGSMLETGVGVARDVGASLTRRQRACHLRNSLACHEAARLLMQVGDEATLAKAREFLEHGCRIGDPAQCGTLAIMVRHGRGGLPDETRARALWREACQRRHLAACLDLIGRNEKLPLNDDDTKAARAEACRAGIAPACTHTL